MTAAEQGYLLLCTELSDGLQPLSLAQLQLLRRQVRAAGPPDRPDARLDAPAVRRLGFSQEQAARIAALMDRKERLADYLARAERCGIRALTLRSPDYPAALRSRLGERTPPVLFARGALSLLGTRCVSLVGSRELTEQGAAFAARVGELAAREGFTLVSGNAAGADRTAQTACLDAGGAVICVLADSLAEHAPEDRVLFLSESGWDLPFSTLRALHRNLVIHGLGCRVLVAQTGFGHGGTWRGTSEALARGLGPVFVHDDGSPGAEALCRRGATAVALAALTELSTLQPANPSAFD